MQMVRNPILFDRGGPQFVRPPPRLGEHTQEVLDEIGLAERSSKIAPRREEQRL